MRTLIQPDTARTDTHNGFGYKRINCSVAGSDEPPPAELVNADGRSNTVLVCDHASNRVTAPALDPTILI
jgi:hypothetical protein